VNGPLDDVKGGKARRRSKTRSWCHWHFSGSFRGSAKWKKAAAPKHGAAAG